MLHSGDEYEIRARSERQRELRRLTGFVRDFLAGGDTRVSSTQAHRLEGGACANDQMPRAERAA